MIEEFLNAVYEKEEMKFINSSSENSKDTITVCYNNSLSQLVELYSIFNFTAVCFGIHCFHVAIKQLLAYLVS